jgi:hypothetical protein
MFSLASLYSETLCPRKPNIGFVCSQDPKLANKESGRNFIENWLNYGYFCKKWAN